MTTFCFGAYKVNYSMLHTVPLFPSFSPLYLILSPLLDSPDNSIHDRLGSARWRRPVDTEQCKKFVRLCFCKKIQGISFYVSILTWEGLAWLRMRTAWQRRPSESSLLLTRNIPCKDMHACNRNNMANFVIIKDNYFGVCHNMAMRRIFWGFCRNWFLMNHDSLTLPFEPFGFKFVEISPIRGVTDSAYQWYGESPTPRITDTRSRRLPASLIRGVGDFPHHWYGESAIKFLKRKLSVSTIWRVIDSPH